MIDQKDDGYWIWLKSTLECPYEITGKYLFFSESKDKLLEIAKNEITENKFHLAKVSKDTESGQYSDHVLCLYYKDESRKHDLAKKYKIPEFGDVKYRYWKLDRDTSLGIYHNQNQHRKRMISKLEEKGYKLELTYDEVMADIDRLDEQYKIESFGAGGGIMIGSMKYKRKSMTCILAMKDGVIFAFPLDDPEFNVDEI